jgi:hypothetical protein
VRFDGQDRADAGPFTAVIAHTCIGGVADNKTISKWAISGHAGLNAAGFMKDVSLAPGFLHRAT